MPPVPRRSRQCWPTEALEAAMKKIGIVGGVGWRSTLDYYGRLCRLAEQWHAQQGLPGTPVMPEISIESLDLATAISYLGCDEDEVSWAKFDDYHRAALQRLENSGAEIALIASNTPHHRFDSIVRGVQIQVVNIFQEVAKESASIGVKHVLL